MHNKIFLVLLPILLASSFISANETHQFITLEWDCSEGLARMESCQAKANLWKLLRYYECQGRNYCCPTSAIIVLNALGVEAPASKSFGQYRLFTQENFFTDEIIKIVDPAVVSQVGMTMDQLVRALKTFPIQVTPYKALELSDNEIRNLLSTSLNNPQEAVLINYQRKEIGQIGDGHWSPLAAYDASSDSFLILDVARYKYPPVWVKTPDLIRALKTLDGENSRGFLILQKGKS